jgi:C-terminal processing protease CtpA/Prc
MDLSMPMLSRAVHAADVREHHPASGTEVAPGVSYVDLDGLKIERWQSIFPSLTNARAIILDMRGYPTNAAFTLIGHFITHEIRSPVLQKPLLETGDYQTSFWTIRPMAPKLDAKLVVMLDGRAMSAAETFLQMVHDSHVALMVGEPSAGTNGVVKVVALPGGFSIRFTGMRVLLADGTALQGHGIAPDLVVHPTLEGVRAGRDELLEVAVSRAIELIAKPGTN